MEKNLSLDAVKVGTRFRRDMGDLKSLAADMKEQGLIVPIGVTPRNVLVCGERRLRAAKQLGWKTIRASVVESIDDELKLLHAEEAENNLHKPFTPSERVAMREAILDSEKACQNGEDRRPPTKLPKVTAVEASKRAGFGSDTEFKEARTVVANNYKPLVKAMDAGQITIYQAALLARMPKSSLVDIFESDKEPMAAYKEKKKEEQKKAEPSLMETMLQFLSGVLGRPWGIAEQYGSAAEMFNSSQFQQKKNQLLIGQYCDKVSAIAKAYADLDQQCRAYRKKHGI